MIQYCPSMIWRKKNWKLNKERIIHNKVVGWNPAVEFGTTLHVDFAVDYMLKVFFSVWSIFSFFIFTHPGYFHFNCKGFTSPESTQMSLTRNEKDQFQFLSIDPKNPKQNTTHVCLFERTIAVNHINAGMIHSRSRARFVQKPTTRVISTALTLHRPFWIDILWLE